MNSKYGGMNAQITIRTEAIPTAIAAGAPASRPAANIAGRYIEKRRSDDAHPATKRISVALVKHATPIRAAVHE